MKRYNVINAEDKVIRTVVAGNIKAASGKVKHLYGKDACFVRIEFKETEETK